MQKIFSGTPLLVKICGNRYNEDSWRVAACEPDFMGWIFSPLSPRRIEPATAARLIHSLRRSYPGIRHVGVFARNSIPEILSIFRRVPQLDCAQVVESVGFLEMLRLKAKFGPLLLPALRVGSKIDDGDIVKYGSAPLFVLDSFVPGMAGGTGKRLEADYIKGVRRPYLLAGGLRPDNLEEALADFSGAGVDVSSGLERPGTPGRKDPEKLREFFRICRAYRRNDSQSREGRRL